MSNSRSFTLEEKLFALTQLERNQHLDPVKRQQLLEELEEEEIELRSRPTPQEPRQPIDFTGVNEGAVRALELAKEPAPMLDQTASLLGAMDAQGGVFAYAARYKPLPKTLGDGPVFDLNTGKLEPQDDPTLIFPDVSDL